MAAQDDVFVQGKYKAVIAEIVADTQGSSSPPELFLIAHPSEEGQYPAMVFLHGYSIPNFMYRELLLHVASHGIIVVAPQLYIIAGTDATEEIKSAAAVVNWLPSGLQAKLPKGVQPDLKRLALAGHSRGGKVAFALSLGLEAKATLPFAAILGIDPVDGTGPENQTNPPVLTKVPDSLDPKAPVLVVGTGLGSVKKDLLLPPCAPAGVNHEEFFKELVAPAFHAVARDYGHMDVLDDAVVDILCASGKSREPMRRFVGGIMVAFLKAYFMHDFDDLNKILAMPDQVSPVVLSTVESKKN